ncbi:unnamed protein product [Cylindrotheca closterium]|uniref:TPM domain-containing protein n=1 Tax=Cylindrotheca closterium TaxID=2856 RepID=A0AAD2CTH9_9STRA|nr:unnamed protein product [Cylindrotheca closterium]
MKVLRRTLLVGCIAFAAAFAGETTNGQHCRRKILQGAIGFAAGVAVAPPAFARLESVNRPDLLPAEDNLHVIQTEKFLTNGQVRRMEQLLVQLERETGFRIYVLCQNYPLTPGLAIRDYWDLGKEGQKDDKYVVLIADQFGGRGM